MSDLITDITNYYNKQKKNMSYPENIDIKFVEKKNNKIVEIYDSNKKLLTKSKYSIIGLFNTTTSNWYWGWFLDFVDRDLVDNTKKIKEWGKKILESKKIKSKHNQALYFYTKNGSFMTNSMNVSFLAKLALYVLKGKYYFPIMHSEEGSNAIQEYIVIY